MTKPTPWTVQYHDRTITFRPVFREHRDRGTLIGYAFKCPKCAVEPPEHFAENWIDTESGTRHKLSFDEQGRAMLEGSILCRSKYAGHAECGWHVIIEHGVARDA